MHNYSNNSNDNEDDDDNTTHFAIMRVPNIFCMCNYICTLLLFYSPYIEDVLIDVWCVYTSIAMNWKTFNLN